MVSLNPTAEGISGGGGGGGSNTAGFFGSTLPAEQQLQQQQLQQQQQLAVAGSMAAMPAAIVAEDPSKKIRKPYTITKSRESWTEQEHDKFLEALQLFDRDWKKIEAFVGSKTVIQIRSHAQKYFLKVQKNGTSEHVPPPRPKRKAAHPYPQKASKNAPLLPQAVNPVHASSCLLETAYAPRTDSSCVRTNSTASATMSSRSPNPVPHVSGSRVTKEVGRPVGGLVVDNCISSSESSPRSLPTCETTDQGNQVPSLRVMPDFAQVYGFIGSVFDPSTTGHLQKLKEMAPVDVETVLLLMHNLSMNLSSPDFEIQRKLLSSNDGVTGDFKCSGESGIVQSYETLNPAFIFSRVEGE